MQCQGVKVEVVHLSIAQDNAVCGSLVLQDAEWAPDLKPPGRTKRKCSGVPLTRVKNVPQSCEESISCPVAFIHG